MSSRLIVTVSVFETRDVSPVPPAMSTVFPFDIVWLVPLSAVKFHVYTCADRLIVCSLTPVTCPVVLVVTVYIAVKLPPKIGVMLVVVSFRVVSSWLTVTTGPTEFTVVIYVPQFTSVM